jgi:hypothetical protein
MGLWLLAWWDFGFEPARGMDVCACDDVHCKIIGKWLNHVCFSWMLCHIKVLIFRLPRNMPTQAQRGSWIQLYPHTTLVPEAVHPGCFIPMKGPVSSCRRFGGPWGWLGQGRKIFPPEFNPWTVQAAASYYTDYATPATKHQDIQVNILTQTTQNI